MGDDFKSIADSLLRVVIGRGSAGSDKDGENGAENVDANTAKALISAVFARAGKGKDEVVQIIAREIGLAVAAMLKEPLSLLAKHQKLQISFEFVPKHGHEEEANEEGKKASHRHVRRARASKRAATRRTPETSITPESDS